MSNRIKGSPFTIHRRFLFPHRKRENFPHHRFPASQIKKRFHKKDGKGFGPFSEVEIESKDAPREEIAKPAAYLRNNPGLEASQQSKYERGVGMIITEKG